MSLSSHATADQGDDEMQEIQFETREQKGLSCLKSVSTDARMCVQPLCASACVRTYVYVLKEGESVRKRENMCVLCVRACLLACVCVCVCVCVFL